MTIFPSTLIRAAACITCMLPLAACSPKLDWRETRGSNAPFVVLLPAKPASYTRPVNLDGLQVSMTMTAAEVDKVMYAVGSAELPDESQAPKALAAMKTALVHNISGTVRQEKVSPAGSVPMTVDVEATGTESRILIARFLAKDKRIYQVVMLGKEGKVSREAADTFFNSFKLN
ncbi:MAG TPA: hypothetical protein VJ698_17765 [Noviherbaspirillum sp.]|uniref:hypothetical protein n=1 Tax=Noviherbaspirillum sp. TaxID=1926288 RepID=UPI002B49E655|nr:hypothetical protein [Noviherbaspirillum sp.]HJV87319.1 hypothetical protein [Noviherbaspirillum sp.]